jgi:hypothetical protein
MSHDRAASWEIKAIKHWPDGSWDAMVVFTEDGTRRTRRIVSEDGFKWATNYNRKIDDEVQDDLTRCMGDMLDAGIAYVKF